MCSKTQCEDSVTEGYCWWEGQRGFRSWWFCCCFIHYMMWTCLCVHGAYMFIKCHTSKDKDWQTVAPHHLNKFLHPFTTGAHPISLCLLMKPWWLLPCASLLITFTCVNDRPTFAGLHAGVLSALSCKTCCLSTAQITVCPSLTHSWYVAWIHLGPQHTWFFTIPFLEQFIFSPSL